MCNHIVTSIMTYSYIFTVIGGATAYQSPFASILAIWYQSERLAPILHCLHAMMLQAVCCMACLSTIHDHPSNCDITQTPYTIQNMWSISPFHSSGKVLWWAAVQGDPFLYSQASHANDNYTIQVCLRRNLCLHMLKQG